MSLNIQILKCPFLFSLSVAEMEVLEHQQSLSLLLLLLLHYTLKTETVEKV